MHMHVNETGRNNLSACVTCVPGGRTLQATDLGDTIASDSDVGAKAWISGTVDDRAIGDN